MWVDGLTPEGEICQFEGTVKGFEGGFYDVRGSDENFPEGPFDASQLTRCAKAASNDSFYKAQTCFECGRRAGVQPAGTLCAEDSIKLWQIRYDEASDTTTYVDQKGEQHQFIGSALPDQLYIHPDTSPEFAELLLAKVKEWRRQLVELQQKDKRLNKFRTLVRFERQAEANQRTMKLKVDAGEGKRLSAKELFYQFQLIEEERKERDATPFLEAGRAVVHDLAGGFDTFMLTDGKPILKCTADLPPEIVESKEHNAKDADQHIWGTNDVKDSHKHVTSHHEYDLGEGDKSLTCVFPSCNGTYGGWAQYKMKNEYGGGCVPKYCDRFVCNPYNSVPCIIFEKVHDASGDLDKVQKVTVVWMNGRNVNISDEDGSRFVMTDEGVIHPLAPLDGIVHPQEGELFRLSWRTLLL